MNDEKIVELYLLRDEAAIENTAEKYGSRLRNLSFGMVGDLLTAEECENDTYMAAWNSIPPNEPKTYFYAFLARIIRNISLACCRKKTAIKRSAFICELSAEMEECIPSPDDMNCRIDDMVFAETINKFLAGLDPEKRKIFVRRYWYMDSVAEISERFLISESKAKTVLFRTRNKLREFLEKEGYIL